MFTSALGVRLQLFLGISRVAALPAPSELMEAIDNIEVICDESGSGFAVTFRITKSRIGDFGILRNPLLGDLSRLIIAVWVGTRFYVLIDGVIANKQVQASNEPGLSQLVVMGRDLSTLMNMTQLSEPYDYLDTASVANLVLSKYLEYGVMPRVSPTLDMDPQSCVWQLGETDLQFIKRLGGPFNFVFFVQPLAFMESEAYFGPDPTTLAGLPQPALTVDMGAASNVSSLDFSYDPTKPAAALGFYNPPSSPVAFPAIPMPPQPRLPPLALKPALPQREQWVQASQKNDIATVERTLRSAAAKTADCVTATGELDTARYGSVLRPWKTVGVRGAGLAFDGLYAVSSVTHQISRNKYTQAFSLKREGLYPTTPEVIP